MEDYKKGPVIIKGKTKVIYAVDGNELLVILENQDAITKNDNPDETQIMKSKAVSATTTTSMVFQLLEKAGIPVAFEEQISPVAFVAPKCKMIPLEVIIRRYAVGSYLKRCPELAKPENEIPHRFEDLVFELFLKTTGGIARAFNGNPICDMPMDILNSQRPVDDPFISNPYGDSFILYHPKIPNSDVRSGIAQAEITPAMILPEGITVAAIEEITKKVFLTLEEAWAKQNCRLIDFKIEFGLGEDGMLYVADVIDNDSWRLRTNGWKELSKQLFRDNHDLSEVSEKYSLVAKLVKNFC